MIIQNRRFGRSVLAFIRVKMIQKNTKQKFAHAQYIQIQYEGCGLERGGQRILLRVGSQQPGNSSPASLLTSVSTGVNPIWSASLIKSSLHLLALSNTEISSHNIGSPSMLSYSRFIKFPPPARILVFPYSGF